VNNLALLAFSGASSDATIDESVVVSPADEVREALKREHSLRLSGLFRSSHFSLPVKPSASELTIESVLEIFDELAAQYRPAADFVAFDKILDQLVVNAAEQGEGADVESNFSLPQSPLKESRLPLAGAFTPSEDLLEIWRQNVEATLGQSRSAFGLSDRVASAEFGKALTSLVGALGQEFRYAGGPRQIILATDGRFEPLVQVELCERFLIVPDQSSNFLALLESEMHFFLSSGGLFSGGWGDVRLSEPRSMLFVLKERNVRSESGFVRAKELR